jgi:hypothetical protein
MSNIVSSPRKSTTKIRTKKQAELIYNAASTVRLKGSTSKEPVQLSLPFAYPGGGFIVGRAETK